MIFRLPHPPLCFEIPDDWWHAAGMADFVAESEAHSHAPGQYDHVELCASREVAPVIRTPETTLDFRGFGRDRMVSVLTGMRTGAAMPPMEVFKLDEPTGEGFRYRIVHGFHRVFASVAAGYSHVPAVLVANWRELSGSPLDLR